jgi:hypothetical protein
MTAVVSRERAKATYLTGVTGVLMLAVAFMMMVVAAPAHVHHRAQGPANASATQLTADSAWTEAYVVSPGTPRR